MPKVYKDNPIPATDKQKDLRCEHCNKLIVKVSTDTVGQVEIVCPRCNHKMIVDLTDMKYN